MYEKIKIPSFKKASVKLADFSRGMNGEINEKIARADIANLVFNFKTSNGGLIDGEGIGDFVISNANGEIKPLFGGEVSPLKCFFYKRYDYLTESQNDRLLVYCDDGFIYEFEFLQSSSNFVKINDLYFSEPPSHVCYKLDGDDVIIFSSSSEMKIYDGVSVEAVEGAPSISSMCIHSERLFVTTKGEQTSLWFSDDFNPREWYVSLNSAGFIDFQDPRGRLLKVVSFNNYVYAFRNYGITRISATGGQSDFYATGLFLGSGRIFENAIVECGNQVLYLAEDGFYRFDGISSTRIINCYDKFLLGVDNSKAIGKYYNGNIYFALKMKFSGKIAKVLLIYNVSNGTSYLIKGVNILDIEIVSANEFSKLVFLTENTNKIGELTKQSRLFNKNLNKVWRSNYCDFGISCKKTLKSVSLYCKEKAVLMIKSENGSVTHYLKGSKTRQTYSIGLSGVDFSIEFNSNALNQEISNLILYFNYF